MKKAGSLGSAPAKVYKDEWRPVFSYALPGKGGGGPL